MTFQQLIFALEVANCVSISKAAEKLYTHQSNVSTAIKQLEEELGIRIFSRTKKGVTTTVQGEEFLSYAKEIINQKSFLEKRYAVRNSKQLRRFTISVMRAYFLVEFIRRMYTELYSGETENSYFRLVKHPFNRVLEDVASNRAEMGIVFIQSSKQNRLEKLANLKKLDYVKLGESRMNIVVREGHPILGEKSLRNITKYPYVVSEEEENFNRLFDEPSDAVFKFFKDPPAHVISTNDSMASEEIVATTDAFHISSMPHQYADRYPCVSIPLAGKEAELAFYYVMRKSYTPSTVAEGFIRELEHIFLESQFTTR